MQKKILIIDDDKRITFVILTILQDFGQVVEVGDEIFTMRPAVTVLTITGFSGHPLVH